MFWKFTIGTDCRNASTIHFYGKYHLKIGTFTLGRKVFKNTAPGDSRGGWRKTLNIVDRPTLKIRSFPSTIVRWIAAFLGMHLLRQPEYLNGSMRNHLPNNITQWYFAVTPIVLSSVLLNGMTVMTCHATSYPRGWSAAGCRRTSSRLWRAPVFLKHFLYVFQ